jgi:hypothetical protein
MEKKNAAAVALGRLGGSRKVPKGFSTLTEEERKANASAAANARWAKARKQTAKTVKKKSTGGKK